jgi:hypothetical protein
MAILGHGGWSGGVFFVAMLAGMWLAKRPFITSKVAA